MFTEANDRLSQLVNKGSVSNEHYKLMHLHIPKTAGVSFSGLFLRRFRSTVHLPWDKGGANWIETVRNGIVPTFTTGHIRFREIFFGPIVSSKPLLIMSVVRDPLDRAISDYNYMRSNKHPLHEEFFAAAPDIDTYIGQRSDQGNLQALWLCGYRNSIEDLKGAVARHYVGLAPLDRVDAYATEIQRAFLKGKPMDLQHRNELQHIMHGEKVSVSDISPSVLKKFNDANNLDRMVYEESLASWDRTFV